jgi:sugar lactone lactonase YvrE
MARLSYFWVAPALVAASIGLSGCGGGSALPGSSLPGFARIDQRAPLAENLHNSDRCAKEACIYVGNEGNSITVYSKNANGNVAPIQRISGGYTGLDDVWAVAIDASRNIYAANYQGSIGNLGDVTVYAPGAHGNVAPIATIQGYYGADKMSAPSGIGLDSVGNIYVSGQDSNSVSVYPPGSDGYAPPIQYIKGVYTGLYEPDSLAVSADGTTYVTDWDGHTGSVTVYAPGASGNVAPIQTISGSNTGIDSPNAVAVDTKGRIYVSSTPPGSAAGCCITVYAKNANGNVAPIRSINGSNTQIDLPYGIAVDSKDNIYVTQGKTNSINVYAKGANGNVAPIHVISGSKTKLNVPTGLIVH